METREKKSICRRVWALCPARHALLLASLLWLGLYFALRENRALMNTLCRTLVRPWHRLAGRFYGLVPFSVAEWLIALGVLAALAFLVQLVIHIRRRRGGAALWRWCVSLLTLVSVLFGLFCLWWGVFYYADSFRDRTGLEERPVSADELERVTRYFVEVANDRADDVERDGEGLFTAELSSLFRRSETLYDAVAETLPYLDGPPLGAKPVVFSRIMSLLNNTGFFFPFTAEANVNVDAPLCLLPATVAHELAHQRGVAAEDEANFVAVLTCMESGDADYAYSGALLAYIYLGNALHDADYDAWYALYQDICPAVRADMDANNRYWAQFEGPAAELSEEVYETFLQTYGDDRGMRSYGACVDLLVAWYLPEVTRYP